MLPSASSPPTPGDPAPPGAGRQPTGTRRAWYTAALVFVGACFIDQLTSSGPDTGGITFTVAGDSLVALGGTQQLTPLVTGDVEGPSTRVWTSSDPTVATVDTTGLVTGVATGLVTIAVRLLVPELDTGLVASHAMRVRYASIEIEDADSLEGLGQTVTLTAWGRDVNAAQIATVAASFSAPDTNTAVVSASGQVRARRNGTVTVTATFDNLTDQSDVTVRQVAKSVQLAVNNIVFPALNRDTTVTVIARDVQDSLIASPSVTWLTSDATAVSVTGLGVMRALRIASATITARVDTAQGQLNTSVVQVPTALAVTAGDNQSATVNTAVGAAVCVTAQDAGGSGVANLAVTFAVIAGAGSITGATPVSDAAGVACVGSWTLGTAAGANTLRATAGPLMVDIMATGTAGAATQVARVAGDSQSATVGTAVAIAPRVRLQDAFGNPVAGDAVTFAVASGGGSISGANQTSGANGEAAVLSWTLGTTLGSNTLTATAGLLSTTFTATATPATPTALLLSAGSNQTATVGTAVAVPPSVRVTDNFGNPVANVAVTFGATTGNGAVSGASQTTNVNGLATVGGWTLDTLAGADTLRAIATIGGSPDTVVFTATGVAGAAVLIEDQAGDAQSDTVGTTVTTAPSVLVSDVYRNPKQGVTVTFTVLTGGGTVTGATKVTGANGIATVTSWTLGTAAGTNNNTLRASTGAIADTFRASAVPGPAANIAEVSGNNQVAAPGGTLASPYIVRVTDQYGNGVSLVTINWSAGSGGSITTPSVSNATGFAQALHTLGPSPGTQVATATPAIALAGSPVIFTATANSTPTQIVLNTGNNQSATVGTAVGTPPSVLVTDQAGNPSANVTVTFAIGLGGGSITGATQSTNAAGVATVGSWTLGDTAGTDNNTLTATAPGLQGSPVTFTASATADAAAQVALNAGNNQTTTVGSAVTVPPSVLVTDQFGNPVAGTAVTFTVTAGGGTVSGGAQSTVASTASGVATVANWVLGFVAGSERDTLVATATGLAGSPVTFVASTTARPAAAIAVSAGNNQTDTVALPIAVPPSVRVTDQFGNPVASVAVTFAVGLGGGGVTGGSQTTNASGIATVGSWTLGQTAGTNNNTLTATSGSLTGSPVTFTASATNQAASQIALNGGSGQSAEVNTAVATAPSVIVRDPFNNPVANVAVTFAPPTGSGSVTGGSATTNASGIATVGSWTLGTNVGPDTLRATSTGLTGSPVVITATATVGPASQVAIAAGDNQSGVVSTAVSTAPSVLVTDQFGNPVAGHVVGFAVTGGGGSITGDTATSAANGRATLGSWTLGPAPGANTLSATAVPALTGSPLTFTAQGLAAGPTTMALSSGDGQAGTVGAALAQPYAVLITDASSTPVQGVQVTWAVTSGGGSMSVPSSLTDVNGIATATHTLGTVTGAQTATASVGGLTGSPVTFTATATGDAPTTLVLNAGDGQTATVNTAVAIAPSVRVTDQFGNGVANVAVTFAVTSGGGAIQGANPVNTDASGLATLTGWTLGQVAGTNNNALRAVAAAVPNDTVLFVASATAGPATQLALAAGDGQTATVNTQVPLPPSVRVSDSFGNPVPLFFVSFAVTGGGGTVQGSGTFTSPSGIAQSGIWTLGTVSGVNSLEFTASGLAGSPVTVTATGVGGPPSTATSVVQVGDDTVASGTSTTLTLLSMDAFGNAAESGHAVTFTPFASGTSSGSYGPVTDNGDGSYSSSFTGVIAGTPLAIGAVIDGLDVTTPQPTITVIPGAPSQLALFAGNNQSTQVNSSVSVNPAVRVTDLAGNPVGGVAVTFAVTGGGGSVQGGNATTAVANGVASVTRWTLGTVAGTNTLSATAPGLAGSPVAFTATGTPGPFSASQSVVLVSSDTVQASFVDTLTLRARDQFGNDHVTGGLSNVVFTLSGGTSDGSLGATTDNGDGTYVAFYTGTVAGTADTVRATVNGVLVTTPPPTVRVVAGPPAGISIIAGDGQSGMVGSAVSVSPAAVVQDAFGNVVPGTFVEFTALNGGFVDLGGGLDPGPIGSYTDAAGVISARWILGTTAGLNQLRVSAIEGVPTVPEVFATATGTVPVTLGSIRLGNLHLGESPVAVAALPRAQRVFVGTEGGVATSPGISLIDAVSDTAAAFSSPVVAFAPRDMAASDVESAFYVSYTGTSQIRQIFADGSSGFTSLAPCSQVAGVAVAEAQDRVYVAAPFCGDVYAFDRTNLNFITELFVGGAPLDMAADNQGRVYVANATVGTIDVLCGGSGSACGFSNLQFLGSMFIGGRPRSVAVDTATRAIFATNESGQLAAMDGSCACVKAIVPLPFTGTHVEVNAATALVYVSDSGTGLVAVYDEFSLGLQAILAVGRGPGRMAADQRTGRVYVANAGSGTVSVLSGATVLTTVARAGPPRSVAVSHNLSRIYVGVDTSANVIVVDATSQQVVDAFPVSGSGSVDGVAANALEGFVFATASDSGRLVMFDFTGQRVASVSVGTKPGAVTINPKTGFLYAGSCDGLTTVTWPAYSATTTGLGYCVSSVAVDSTTDSVYAAASAGPAATSVVHGPSGVVGSTLADNASTSVAFQALPQQVWLVYPTCCVPRMRVYRAADHAVLAELPYGNPEVVAVNDATRAVFMTQSGSGVRVVSADLLQEVFALTEPFTFSGTGIAVNTFNGRIYVADYGSGVLRVYQN